MPIFSKSSGEYVGSQVRTSQVQMKTQNTEKNVRVYMDASKNRDAPKWMVKIMENPIKMDDLGVFPLFLESPI